MRRSLPVVLPLTISFNTVAPVFKSRWSGTHFWRCSGTLLLGLPVLVGGNSLIVEIAGLSNIHQTKVLLNAFAYKRAVHDTRLHNGLLNTRVRTVDQVSWALVVVRHVLHRSSALFTWSGLEGAYTGFAVNKTGCLIVVTVTHFGHRICAKFLMNILVMLAISHAILVSVLALAA